MRPSVNVAAEGPRIDRDFHPGWHRHGANAPMFAHEINNAPPAIPLLKMCEREVCGLRSPESATKENGQDGAVA